MPLSSVASLNPAGRSILPLLDCLTISSSMGGFDAI
jgi:hypothetical protein